MDLKENIKSSRPEKWTAGVDWFRWKVERMDMVRETLARIAQLQEADIEQASRVRPWSFQGYEGVATDSIRWGKRSGKLIWESSGERAASTMAFMGPSGGYCLRCDLQTTLTFSSSQPHLGTSLMRSSQATTPTLRRSPILRGVSTRTDGLWIGTVGRRTSRSYLRLYDKGVESKLAPKGMMWRVELEAKHSHSRQLCLDHLTSLQNPKFCASYVASSVMRSGLRWPFSELASLPVDVNLGRKQETTAGSLAIWLTHTVRPTIPRLLTVFTVAEVLEMLKLSGVAAPIGRGNVRAEYAEDARRRRADMARDVSVRVPGRRRVDQLGNNGGRSRVQRTP
jgi:hypothetical protein